MSRYRLAAYVVAATLLATPLVACDRGDDTDEPAIRGEVLARTPEQRVRTVGLDSVQMADALQRAAELPRLRTLLVSRHGELEVERHFRGPGLSTPANVKSVSKSILSALVGIAIAEGHLEGPDQPIGAFFPTHLGAGVDARKREITTGQLLSMQSGLEGTSGSSYGRWVTSRNWVGHALAQPMVADPGTRRIYSTGNSHLLSAILTRSTGQSTWAYARDRLAEPLGVQLPRWPTDPQGIFFGGNEMRLTPMAMVRFGELYRNGGTHEGRQVIPEEWVRASLEPRAAGSSPPCEVTRCSMPGGTAGSSSSWCPIWSSPWLPRPTPTWSGSGTTSAPYARCSPTGSSRRPRPGAARSVANRTWPSGRLRRSPAAPSMGSGMHAGSQDAYSLA
jgi:CubicO group peptidase (beta-lactamase class C family)